MNFLQSYLLFSNSVKSRKTPFVTFGLIEIMAKKKRKGLKIGLLLFVVAFFVCAGIVWKYYGKIYERAVHISEEEQYLFIKTGCDRDQLINHLYLEGILKDTSSFIWLADQKKYLTPKPGRYLISDGMSNNALVNLLRSGAQVPVQLTFNTIRTAKDLAGKVGKQIEADSAQIYSMLTNVSVASKYGFNKQTFLTLFIPNTYEVYWNMSAEEFIGKMAQEYKRFWNEERLAKARKIGLSQSEVSILASIVQAEQSQHRDERPKVAGLYLNRIKKGMKLESDPTLVFAHGDFSIRRVLNKHKKIVSPYNTYKRVGLPPGPINLPEFSSLEAVLNSEKHDYIFMCAKADFSGYHDFSKTYRQHVNYANAYRRELNKRRIIK